MFPGMGGGWPGWEKVPIERVPAGNGTCKADFDDAPSMWGGAEHHRVGESEVFVRNGILAGQSRHRPAGGSLWAPYLRGRKPSGVNTTPPFGNPNWGTP